MSVRLARLALLVGLIIMPTWVARAADDGLTAAYAAILRGDYEAGRTAVDSLLKDRDPAETERVHDWLKSYRQEVEARNELKTKTMEWNVENAREALADKDKTFLALSFTAQACAYAADPNDLTQSPWVAELTERCKAEARECEKADRWTRALNYYMLLERLYPKNEEISKLSEDAMRHARIEVLYEDDKSMRERIKDVNKDLLQTAVRLIHRLYYEEPDFKKAAGGALDNLTTLCGTSKLYKYLDGLANPALRQHFLRGLDDLRTELKGTTEYSYKDLLRLFNQVSELNRGSIELPDGLLVIEFLEGVHNDLDEYTDVFWPADSKDFEKRMMGGFDGIGIQLGLDEHSNRLKVVTPLENSPALEAGIQPDDLIVTVNGESTKGWNTDDAVRNIMGPAGTEVVLTMLRPSTGEELAFKLIRRNIVLASVRGVGRSPDDINAWNYMLDKEAGVAYIRLTNFLPGSQAELTRALEDAHTQGMKALVLDIRHNPGGLLEVAIEVVSDFLEEGEVVSTRGRLESDIRERVAGKALYKDIALVILVNEGSASASEILAGALQDHHRAIVVGERTFGKGMVQHIRPLGDTEARLKLTTALWYLPSGRSLQKWPHADTWGVEPDWNLKLTPKEFRQVIERERETYIIHNENRDSGNKVLSEEEREKLLASLKGDSEDKDDEPPLLTDADIKLLDSDPYPAPKSDPQLDTALLMIRVKLAANVPWPRELASAERLDKR